MRLINTQLSVFALILPFLMNLCCTSATKDRESDSDEIIEPMISRSSEPMQSLNSSSISALMGNRVYPSREFIGKCQSRLSHHRVHQDYRSHECLLFCGYMDIGMLNHDADVKKKYLRDRLSQRSLERALPKIMKCVERTGANRRVCTKATNNAWCVCQHIAKCEIVWELRDVV